MEALGSCDLLISASTVVRTIGLHPLPGNVFFGKQIFLAVFHCVVNVLLECASWLWDVCSSVGNVLLVTATAECYPACLLATPAF